MLKKAKIRLLTRAAHCRESVFGGVYRAATVRERVPNGLCAERCPTAAWDMQKFELLISYAGKPYAGSPLVPTHA